MPTTTRTPDTLRLPASRHPVPTSTRVRTRRLPLIAYVAVLLALPAAVVLGARTTGWWVTTGHVVPATALGADAIGTRPTGGPGPAKGAAGEAAPSQGGSGQSGSGQGQSGGSGAVVSNPADIKGSMTVQQIVDAFPPITTAEIFKKFGVPATTSTSTQLKVLAQTGNGYDVTALREWVATRIAAR